MDPAKLFNGILADHADAQALAAPASEDQADKAVATLKRWINAAENSNQHGENMVTRAVALASLDDDELADMFSDAMSDVHDMDTTLTDFAKACVRALRKEAP